MEQSPCHTGLGTKVAVHWEQNVVLVHDAVDTIGFVVLRQHHNSA